MPRILLYLLVAAFTVPALAQDSANSVNLQEIAKQIREGKIDVGKELSVDFTTGRLHKIHAGAIGLGCSSCHYGKSYQSDVLLLRKYERSPAIGQIDYGACLGCHKSDGVASTFYVGRPGEEPE